MSASASLGVRCRDEAVARSLAAVLAPDNEGGPRGLSVAMRRSASVVSATIRADSPATALSTSLAFLRDITLFQEVWLLSQPGQG